MSKCAVEEERMGSKRKRIKYMLMTDRLEIACGHTDRSFRQDEKLSKILYSPASSLVWKVVLLVLLQLAMGLVLSSSRPTIASFQRFFGWGPVARTKRT